MLDGVDVSAIAQRCSVSLHVMFIACAVSFHSTTTHDCLTNDEGRALFLFQCCVQCLADLCHVIAIDLNDIPVPCTVFCCGVLAHHVFGLCRQLNVIGVVEHDEVVKT